MVEIAFFDKIHDCCCINRRDVYFRKLLFETVNKKFNLIRVKSNKICGHAGGNLLQRSLVGRVQYLSQSYKDGMRKKSSIICIKVTF